MDVAKINELQDHFDGRGRLKQVANAIKCFTKNASVFYSYIDGWGNKKCINIPIEPSDLLPLLQRYIDGIDKDIIALTTPTIKVLVNNYADLEYSILDYQNRYPKTATSYETIASRLKEIYLARVEGSDQDDLMRPQSYHIEVCSDWQDKIYMFSLVGVEGDTAVFRFDDIYKL